MYFGTSHDRNHYLKLIVIYWEISVQTLLCGLMANVMHYQSGFKGMPRLVVKVLLLHADWMVLEVLLVPRTNRSLLDLYIRNFIKQ